MDKQYKRFLFGKIEKKNNKLGLSCAKLRPAWLIYQLASRQLAYAEVNYYVQLYVYLVSRSWKEMVSEEIWSQFLN